MRASRSRKIRQPLLRSLRRPRCGPRDCARRESASFLRALRSIENALPLRLQFRRPVASLRPECARGLRERPPWRSHRRAVTAARGAEHAPGSRQIPACASSASASDAASRIVTAGCDSAHDAQIASRALQLRRSAIQRSTIQAGCACNALRRPSDEPGRGACTSLRSTAFTMPEAKRWPACFASSTLSSMAACAGMRSRCSS